jgi:hypothetical protein
MQRAAMRALFIPVYGLAGLGTAAAYMHFITGAIAGFEGIIKGRYFLGPVLSVLCLLGAFALWRVWSIGGRIWHYGAYAHASPKDYRYDRAGMAAAGAAFIGFVAIANAIYRTEELVIFGILLMPATCLAIITLLWITSDPSASVDDVEDARSAAPLQLADLPGLVCATALGLYGVYRFVPLPISGWGACDWTLFYPLQSGLWPYERSEVFDACDDGAWSLTLITGVLSLVCLLSGAAAAVIGKNANSRRGTWAAGIVVAVVLAWLAIQMSEVPTAWHMAWVESVITGALIVVGAAWVGYVGGRRGVELSRWLFAHARMPAPQIGRRPS